MKDEDYKLEDVGSLAKKIPSSEWPLWKKLVLFISIAAILIMVLVIIILLVSKRSSNTNNGEINESKVIGDIRCEFDVDEIYSYTPILGK